MHMVGYGYNTVLQDIFIFPDVLPALDLKSHPDRSYPENKGVQKKSDHALPEQKPFGTVDVRVLSIENDTSVHMHFQVVLIRLGRIWESVGLWVKHHSPVGTPSFRLLFL